MGDSMNPDRTRQRTAGLHRSPTRWWAGWLLAPVLAGGGCGDSTSPGDAIAAVSLDLETLALAGGHSLVPPFDPEVTEYTARVSVLVGAVAVITTPVSRSATVAVDGVVVHGDEPSPAIELDPARTVVAIDVTAPDQRQKIYTITVDRDDPFAETLYAQAPHRDSNDRFGYAVAVFGDTLAVSSPGDDSAAAGIDGDPSDNELTDSGSVYVFRRTTTDGGGRAEYAREAYLKASHPSEGDYFGVSVALHGDTLAVGVYRDDSSTGGIDGDPGDDTMADSGAVYIFTRSDGPGGGVWQQTAYLKASHPGPGDWFGWRLSLWGDTLAVAACLEDGSGGEPADPAGDGVTNSGAIYVFKQRGGDWHQEAYLKAAVPGPDDRLGWSVSVRGEWLAAGAVYEDSGASGVDGDPGDDSVTNSGAVYVFHREGDRWTEDAYVKAAYPAAEDRFGWSVAVDDPTPAAGPRDARPVRLAIGAHLEDGGAIGTGGDPSSESSPSSGAAYLFRRDDSRWEPELYLKSSNSDPFDYFGWSVTLRRDLLVVGALYEDSASPGVDGDQHDDSAGNSGAAYLFHHDGQRWVQRAYIKASNPSQGDYFGWNSALSDDTLVFGALHQDGDPDAGTAADSGAIYVFR